MDNGKVEISTNTIAELYIKQGYLDKALDIYKAIVELEPSNEFAKAKVAELEGKIAGVEGEGAISESETPEAVSAIPVAEGNELEDQIARLEDWLNDIREVKGQR